MATITSANSALAFRIAGLFDSSVPMQGYAADDAFTTDAQTIAEAVMGVDGFLSAGYTPQPIKLKVKLQADSPSQQLFDDWARAMTSSRDILYANAQLDLPGPGLSYAMTKGALTSYKPIADGKKKLDPREFEITFESCVPSPL